MTDDDITSGPEELAALYAAGVLPPDEAAAVESRLDAGDRLLAEEIASYEVVLAALAEGTEPAAPSPKTKEELFERIAQMGPNRARAGGHGRAEEAAPDILVRRGESRKWIDSGLPGIEVCVLYRDPVRNIDTRLIRVAPGMTIPAHSHPGVEECFLVEGDLQTYGRDLRAGDYLMAPAGSLHPDSHTKNGCLFLITVIGRAEAHA